MYLQWLLRQQRVHCLFSYLATALPIVGPVAKAFNFSIEDTLALVGKLADAGFDASMSATATRNILLNFSRYKRGTCQVVRWSGENIT